MATVIVRTDLHNMDFGALRDYLVAALADRQKAQAVIKASCESPLLERFTGLERVLLGDLYSSIMNNHARA